MSRTFIKGMLTNIFATSICYFKLQNLILSLHDLSEPLQNLLYFYGQDKHENNIFLYSGSELFKAIVKNKDFAYFPKEVI